MQRATLTDMVDGWSKARIHAFIVSVLRAGTRRWPPKFETMHEAKTEKRKNQATGRQAQHYACAECKEDFPAKQVQVDHKKPVVDPKRGFVDWNTYIERLFCDKKNFQVLCLECHKVKTKKEKTP
jgi:5-methylcytosine-specific restriction endonuclease McrA